MSDSEDEAAFASADEGEVAAGKHTDKKKEHFNGSAKDNKTKGNKKKSQQKKKGKLSKPKEEETVEKLINSFESSDSTISNDTAAAPPQIDNMQSSKPDLEEVRITDDSDDNRTRSNLSEEDEHHALLQDSNVKLECMSLDNKEMENYKETLSEKGDVKGEKEKSEKSSWGWGNWGSSIIGAAASSVSTFTTQLGDGVNTIIDNVETGLSSVPSPEELAHEAKEGECLTQVKEPKGKKPEEESPEDPLSVGDNPIVVVEESIERGEGAVFGGWLSGWGVSKFTGAVHEKSKTLVTGSLDVLESIGRKTFDAINDHDPVGLRDKTKMLFERSESPQLTDLLKEAKEQSEIKEKIAQENDEALKSDFGALFEDQQGQAHMDALRLLSQQSEAKLSAMLESPSSHEEEEEIKIQLLAVRDAFEVAIEDEDDLDEDHLFARLVTDHLSDVHLGTQPDKLNKCQANTRQWIVQFFETHSTEEEKKEANPKDIYTTAIQSLAELTAKIIEQFHKAGELILLQKDLDKSIEDRAKSLASLTKIFWTEVNILSTKFAKCLNTIIAEENELKSINQYITNVYLEASNSSSYIDDGFRSLLPIMQLALLEKKWKD